MQKKNLGLRIGITGGIGAGKSTISGIFKVLGIPVYNADERAKHLMNHDLALIQQIIEIFGSDLYQNGELNRIKLAKLVFEDSNALERLNQLVHPAVRRDYEEWLDQYKNSDYTIKEAALLFESGSYKGLDQTILVYAPLTTRINRVLLRDKNRSKMDIQNIINKQMDDNHKKKLADFTIINDDTALVIPQVLKIHQLLLSQSAEKK